MYKLFYVSLQKIIVMTRIVTSSEFKANHDEPTKMDEEQFYALIDHSIKQMEEGHFTKQMDGESIDDFVDRLLCTK